MLKKSAPFRASERSAISLQEWSCKGAAVMTHRTSKLSHLRLMLLTLAAAGLISLAISGCNSHRSEKQEEGQSAGSRHHSADDRWHVHECRRFACDTRRALRRPGLAKRVDGIDGYLGHVECGGAGS